MYKIFFSASLIIICCFHLTLPFPITDYDDSLDTIAGEIFVSAQKSGNVKSYLSRILENLDNFMTYFQVKNDETTTFGQSNTNTETANPSTTKKVSNSKEESKTSFRKTAKLHNMLEERKEMEPITSLKNKLSSKSQFKENRILMAIEKMNTEAIEDRFIPSFLKNSSMNEIIKILFGRDSESLKINLSIEQKTPKSRTQLNSVLFEDNNFSDSSSKINFEDSVFAIDKGNHSKLERGKFENQVLTLLRSDESATDNPTTCYCFPLPTCVTTEKEMTTTLEEITTKITTKETTTETTTEETTTEITTEKTTICITTVVTSCKLAEYFEMGRLK